MCNCPALPEPIECLNMATCYLDYFPNLHKNIFLKDLYNNKIFYRGLPISLKKYPIEADGTESSFYHLTHRNYDTDNTTDRVPDFQRASRLNWIKPTIETDHNIFCNRQCVFYFEEYFKNGKVRINLLNEKDRYLIVLERRENFLLLITAFYIEYDNALKKKKDKYNRYCQKGKPI